MCNKQLRLLQLYNAHGYRNLHICDGNNQYLQQAMMVDAYSSFIREVVQPNKPASFLLGTGLLPLDSVDLYMNEQPASAESRYDCVLSSMSYAAYKEVYEQLLNHAIKPGSAVTYILLYLR